MSTLQKTIRCSRCRKDKIVPSNWTYKQCVDCHERDLKRGLSIPDIEKRTIEKMFDFETAYRRLKKHNPFKLTKEQFRKEWMEHQQPKIQRVKETIAKYNDRNAPLRDVECLEFRRLLSLRNSTVGDDKLTAKESEFFYNHASSCDSCSRYTAIHRDGVQTEPEKEFHEANQKEFDNALDDFFSVMNENRDD